MASVSRVVDDVLAVVEYDQDALTGQRFGNRLRQRLARAFGDAEDHRDAGSDQFAALDSG